MFVWLQKTAGTNHQRQPGSDQGTGANAALFLTWADEEQDELQQQLQTTMNGGVFVLFVCVCEAASKQNASGVQLGSYCTKDTVVG